jgi:hypothetical protein
LLVSPPCGPHLVPLSTGSLEPSLLVSPSPGGPSRLKTFRARFHLQQHELGRSLHLRTKPRVSPTPVVNHSSLRSGHPSTTGTLLVLTGLIRSEDIVADAGDVIKKFDFGTE